MSIIWIFEDTQNPRHLDVSGTYLTFPGKFSDERPNEVIKEVIALKPKCILSKQRS